jgi:hypothetical protein
VYLQVSSFAVFSKLSQHGHDKSPEGTMEPVAQKSVLKRHDHAVQVTFRPHEIAVRSLERATAAEKTKSKLAR